jgi:hypothetical protein
LSRSILKKIHFCWLPGKKARGLINSARAGQAIEKRRFWYNGGGDNN